MTQQSPSAVTQQVPATIQRFSVIDRTMHLFLMFSFLALAGTGLPLFFADRPWAQSLAGVIGGYGFTGTLHRFAAAVMFAVFFAHLVRVGIRVFGRGERNLLWGPDSFVPRPKDLVDMIQHFRWFLGMGPRPQFDRYTYWEKFDYWAVFWGMGVIGFSGLLMWFPEFFLTFLPGWTLNVALIVHSEEALLAMLFIFTVHFFNGHLRPEKFPMDPVIFTGEMTVEELRHERPAEYERLVAQGRLEASPGKGPNWLAKGGPIAGTLAVAFGWGVVFMTLFSWLTG